MKASWLETTISDAFSDLSALSASSLASQLALVIIVIPAIVETAWSARHRRDRATVLGETGAAAVMGVGGLAVGAALGGLFVVAFEMLRGLAPGSAVELWADHRLLAFVTAFVAWDFVGHIYHRIGHGTTIGWAAHQPHHTGTEFTLSLAWRQSWLPVHAVVLPLVALGGWSISTIVICAAVSNVLQALQHTRAPVRWPSWLTAVVMTPLQHRRHHLSPEAVASALVNLGPVFTVWDRLAGTYDETPVSAGVAFGLEPTTQNPLRLQLAGWRLLAETRRSWRSHS